jgi:hypothetical protein
MHLTALKESIIPFTLWIQVSFDNFYLDHETWYHYGYGMYSNFKFSFQ